MNSAIGSGKTREDHRAVADQLYALYAEGRDLRRLVAIIGEAALSPDDRRILDFARDFELQFINQKMTDRDINETLDIAWKLLAPLPAESLKRVPKEFIEKYHAVKGRK